MARNEQTAAVQIAPPEVAVSGRKDSRSIMLTVPMSDGSTTQMSRTDYIRTRADQGASRGQIRQEVIKLQGVEDVPYQVIFAATKDHPNYAKRSSSAGAQGEEPSDEGETEE